MDLLEEGGQGYTKDPGFAQRQSENRCANRWCQRTSVCVLVRREGISLRAKEDGARLKQHIPGEPAEARTVAGLFSSAKPQPPFLPVSLLVHVTAPAWPAKSGAILRRTGVGL